MSRALGVALIAAVAVTAVAPVRAGAQVKEHYTPAEAEAVFRIANDACLREDYKTCIEGYERLGAAGFASADLYYNLGTAHLKQNRIGPAVLYFERALRIDPNDADARANLERARRMRVDKLVGAPEETAGEEPLASRLAAHTRADRWALAFLILWTAGWTVVVVRRWLRGPGLRFAALGIGLLAVVGSLPGAFVTGAHFYVNEQAHEGVVVAPSVPVREGPQEQFKPTFEVHEGLKVRVVDQDGAFKRIRLSNGLQGWVPAEAVTEISPG